ncbi:NAD(P)/FAD-dependent oxidoreductase [Nocardioides speluncae]|uniref:NAD(P)/FAD-dependent oxidoreductase n=1 Tax=Nocardioides speluncae TaxID=2670337 RepID=UPI000D69B6E1|nr:FAD-binding oxidoreductase [Nocardioides speluncae]
MMKIAVIGAGPLGSATARHLAESGAHVTVFGPDEPATFAGHQGTWSGHYDQGRMAVTDPLLVASILGHRAMARYADLAMRSGVTFSRSHPQLMMFPDGATGEGTQEPSSSHAYRMLDAVLEHSRTFGETPEVLDSAQLHARFPDMRFAANQIGALQHDALIVNPRLLVRAELVLAEAAGATRVRELVVGLESTASQVRLTLADGFTASFDKVVVATGAGTNASGLLPARVDTTVYGATIVLLEVDGPDVVQMPAWMYLDSHHGGGLITPPTQYPDRRWYLKCASGQLLSNPLHSAGEISGWVSTGGESSELDYFQEFVARSLPAVQVRGGHTRPCLPSINTTSVPYIDMVDERVGLVVEGERGVMMADEIGRLSARLTLTGEWRDSLDHHEVAVRWAA